MSNLIIFIIAAIAFGCFANLLWHDLPPRAELVRQPAAGNGLATLKQLVPVAVDLGLVLHTMEYEKAGVSACAGPPFIAGIAGP